MTDFYASTMLALREAQEQTGLSLAELNALDLDEFSRLVHGQTPAQAAIAAYNRQHASEVAATPPAQDPAPDADLGPPGVDVASMDWATYAEFRQGAGIAARSSEGMTRAEVTLMNRMVRNEAAPAGRTSWYSGQ